MCHSAQVWDAVSAWILWALFPRGNSGEGVSGTNSADAVYLRATLVLSFPSFTIHSQIRSPSAIVEAGLGALPGDVNQTFILEGSEPLVISFQSRAAGMSIHGCKRAGEYQEAPKWIA